MVLKPKDANIFIKLFAKQKITKTFKSHLFLAVVLCSEVITVDILYHASILPLSTLEGYRQNIDEESKGMDISILN